MAPNNKRSSRPNRYGIGLLSIIRIGLVLAAFIFANHLSFRNFIRADLSRSGDYSLSSATRNYIRSAALAERSRPVRITMLFRRTSPFRDRVRAIAEEYERKSKGMIEFKVIDPIRSPDRTRQFAATYNLTLVRDLILIDARPRDSVPVITETSSGARALSPHVTLALAEEMLTYASDARGQRRPTAFRAEELITSRLVAAIEGRPGNFLFLADKSRIDSEGDDSPWAKLAQTLRYQNIRITPTDLGGMASIPPGVDGIAIIAPKYDFTDGEINVLENYWNQSRSAILVMLEAGTCPPKLKTFLRAKGITPRANRIVSLQDGRILTTARGNYSQGVPFLKDLAGGTAVFEGSSSSLEIRENADDLSIRKIQPFPLIRIGEGFWGEADFGKSPDGTKEGETFDPVSDTAPPLYIAAAVTRGAANDDKLSSEVSRMVVIATTDFLQEDRQRADNIDFLASAANWLVRRDSLAGETPRSIGTYKLPLLDSQVSFINRINLFFAPAAFLIIGGIVFSTRRT